MRSNFHSVEKVVQPGQLLGKKDAIKHGRFSLNCGDKRALWRPHRQCTRRALQAQIRCQEASNSTPTTACKSSLVVVTDYFPKFLLFQRADRTPKSCPDPDKINWNWQANTICLHLEWTVWNFLKFVSTLRNCSKFKVPDKEECNCSVRPGAHWEARAIRTMPKQRL